MIFYEETLSSEKIYNGHILNLRKDKVKTINGFSYREIIEHGGAAVILAIKDDKIIMVSQYRKGADEVMIELPAGKLEKGEDPIEAARRELREETGYIANDIAPFMRIYPAAAYCEEVFYIFIATDLTLGEQDLDDNEAIDVSYMSLDEVVAQILSNKIKDAKTISSVLAYHVKKMEGIN